MITLYSLFCYGLGVAMGAISGFFIGVRAEATQGTFHDKYLKRKAK